MYEMNPVYKHTRNSNKYQFVSLKFKDLINIISNCSVISWPTYEINYDLYKILLSVACL